MEVETNNTRIQRKKKRKNSNQNSSDEPRTYLTSSLENIPFFRSQYDEQITEEQRKQLILNELHLVKKEVETKSYETQCKANWFGLLNNATSLAILLSSAVIIGLQAAGNCIDIPVIVLSSIIFVLEGIHKLFRLGPQGTFYKYATIQIKRIGRQTRDYMYMFHKYNSEQLLALIGQLRSQYDDIDLGLYKTSTTGAARYNANLDIEEGGGGNFETIGVSNSNLSQPSLYPASNNSQPVLVSDKSSPHFHIHIDQTPKSGIIPSPYMPERSETNSIVIVNEGTPHKLSVPTNIHVHSGEENISTPNLPKRIASSRKISDKGSATTDMPTIDIDSEDVTSPVSINK
jgi:hypothetical protein